MLGVAMFSLLILRSVVRGTVSGDGGLAAPSLDVQPQSGAAAADIESESEDQRPRLRFKKSKSVKDDLMDIVHEDPDAAADILRSWISKAS